MFSHLKEDYHAVLALDTALHHPLEALFCYPGVTALRRHRRAHKAYLRGHFLHARLISTGTRKRTGIDIHPGAAIGRHLFIDHGMGVVIGETCVIGNHVTLYQGVTLGATGKQTGIRHPVIGDHVMIGAGAKVLGAIHIGHHAKVGAGAVVLHDVPPYATAVGNPARIILHNQHQVSISEEVTPPC